MPSAAAPRTETEFPTHHDKRRRLSRSLRLESKAEPLWRRTGSSGCPLDCMGRVARLRFYLGDLTHTASQPLTCRLRLAGRLESATAPYLVHDHAATSSGRTALFFTLAC